MNATVATAGPDDDRIREAIQDARREGAVGVFVALVLLVLSAVVSEHRGWRLPGAPWWMWLVIAIPELALLIALVVGALGGVHPARRRNVVVVLLGFLALGSLTGMGLLLYGLAAADFSAGQLLLHAGVVWSTNLIVFGLLFWELDQGGPTRRVRVGRVMPDFQFPQDQNPEFARPGWLPRLVDYLYLSLTNSLAFSPTDAMPLSRRAKSLMALQALITYVVVVFVIARAVNVLGP